MWQHDHIDRYLSTPLSRLSVGYLICLIVYSSLRIPWADPKSEQLLPRRVSRDLPGKCPETSTDFALKPAHVPRMLNIRDPLSENVASEADHGDRQL